jgi:FkbM family methyltransferase
LTFNRVTGVDLIEAAVSDSAGPAAFHDYGSTSTPYVSSLASAVDTDATPVVRHVDVVTIDDICRNLGVVPTVVRMDVQGAEIHALRGARETIRAAPRLSLVVEMHPQCWPSFGLTEAMVRDALHELGLSARPLVPGEPLFARDTHAVLNRTGEMGS